MEINFVCILPFTSVPAVTPLWVWIFHLAGGGYFLGPTFKKSLDILMFKTRDFLLTTKEICWFQAIYFFLLHWNLHWDIEEYGEKEFVVDGHRDEPTLIELRGSFSHHDTQTDPPEKDHQLHWRTFLFKLFESFHLIGYHLLGPGPFYCCFNSYFF